MAFTVPPYKTYPLLIMPIPSRERMGPPPGEPLQFAPLEFDWTANGAAQLIDFGQQPTQRPFSQIIMLDVDNSECTCDVQFMFPDTSTTFTVPAGSGGRFPATTAGVRFFAVCLQAPLATDLTRVNALNYRSAPIDIPRTEFNNSDFVTSWAINANGTTQIIPATVSGILSSLYVTVVNPTSGAVPGAANLAFNDGTALTLFAAAVGAPANAEGPGGPLISAPNCNLRFSGGLSLVVTTGATALTAGFVDVVAIYRTPG